MLFGVTTVGTQAYLSLNTSNTNYYGPTTVTSGVQVSFSGAQAFLCAAATYSLTLNYTGYVFGTYTGFLQAARIG